MLTLADIAAWSAAGHALAGSAIANPALANPAIDVEEMYRAIIGFVEEAMAGEPDEVSAGLEHRPEPTGDKRIDAALAAAAEHVAFHRDLPVPAWALDDDRFLDTAWFPIDVPSIRVAALVGAPASFARRLVFIDRRDLERV